MLIKPVDVIKKVSKKRLESSNSLLIFYLDINKKVITSHKKDYIKKIKLRITDVFIPAFYLGAKFIIITHIKPNSKSCQPKKLEKEVVKKVFNTGCFLNIFLLDYLVVTKKEYYSFHESGVV